jgi:HD-like signal output (HDOD) protein
MPDTPQPARVLFVDDEPSVLRGLERLLSPLQGELDLAFATDGRSALALMEARPFDVIVSDMRMPGMDGAALLALVQVLYPRTVRIVLSGYADIPGALRAVPVAHRFFAKPCDIAKLKSMLLRTVALHRLLQDDRMQKLVSGLRELPARPETHARLTALLARPNAAAKDITKLITEDVALCAKLLQLVNSAFFGAPRRITSIEAAVNMLGTGILQSIVLATTVTHEMGRRAKSVGYDIDASSQHAMLTASLARRCFSEPEARDDAFAAGLLHNIGELLLVADGRDTLLAALEHARAKELPLHLAERELGCVSHAHVGAYLLGTWGLSYALVEAVAHHHDPVSREPASVPQEGTAQTPEVFDLTTAIRACSAMADYALTRRASSLEEAREVLRDVQGAPKLETLQRWASDATF